MTKLWVDPPEGWRYGFPKIWDDEKETYPQLLRRFGYPERDMVIAMRYCRSWSVDNKDKELVIENIGRTGCSG